MKKNGDNCSICDKAFPHNSKTFGGVTANGTSALVGECCAGKLSETLISGVFVNRNYEELLKIKGNSPNPEVSPEKLSDVITPLQDYFSGVDKLGADIMKSAGVQSKNASVNFSDSSWKRDDADWFKDNPERSHRLRPFFKEEAADLPVAFLKNKPPPNHEFQVLIRQIEVGKRIRAPFCRNLDVPIPDVEEVIYALFDIISNGQHKQGVISVEEVASLATQYSLSSKNDSKPN